MAEAIERHAATMMAPLTISCTQLGQPICEQPDWECLHDERADERARDVAFAA